MKLIRQFAGGILIAEIIIAVVLIVGLMVPLPGKVEFKIVQSGSMEPTLPIGSVVTVVPAAAYAVGDIITFGSDSNKKIPTTHRIESITREEGSIRYVTKGDANEEHDNGLTSYDQVIGRVVYTVPRLGFVLDFARSRRGFTYTVVVPAGLIILDELLTIIGALRAMRRRRSMRDEYENEYGDAVPSNEPPVPSDGVYAFAQNLELSTRHLVPMDGIQPLRRTVPRLAPTVRERVRAGIDGYTVVLRAV